MSDKMSQYFEAYYGTDVPLSQQNAIRKPFVNMVNMIQADILNLVPDADDGQVKLGIIEALLYLNSTGQTQTPDLYVRVVHHANEAFRYAIAATNGKPLRREKTLKEVSISLDREKEATRKAIDEMANRDEAHAKVLESRSVHAANLYRRYKSMKQTFLEQELGVHEAKVKAYTNLIDNWEPNAGIEYYLIGWQIPAEEGIANDPDVLRHQSACPYMDLSGEPKHMMVNGESWGGIKGKHD